MITADDIELIDFVRLQLLECKNEAEIETVFARAEIKDFEAKTAFLHRAMQIQEIFGTPDKNAPVPTEEEVYKYYLKFYFDGIWKEFV